MGKEYNQTKLIDKNRHPKSIYIIDINRFYYIHFEITGEMAVSN